MKLDASGLQYLRREELRTLTCVELGTRNHEIVPTTLIITLSGLPPAKTKKSLQQLHAYKLVARDKAAYNGYKLSYMGYDFLALRSLAQQKILKRIGQKLGVGKESDIFYALCANGEEVVVKLHRLGRTSFRAVKNKRDYLGKRHAGSWMFLSRLSAQREFTFMKALYAKGYPIPEPLGWSRHCIAMQRIYGRPLCNISDLLNPQKTYERLMELIVQLAEIGLVHGDFNEFNLMVDDEDNVTVIDFPQMISTKHPNAEEQFCHDVNCVQLYFKKKFKLEFEDEIDSRALFQSIERKEDLDVQLRASGWQGNDESDDDEDLAEEIDQEEDESESNSSSEDDDDDQEENENSSLN
jgi:RIO kinase 2